MHTAVREHSRTPVAAHTAFSFYPLPRGLRWAWYLLFSCYRVFALSAATGLFERLYSRRLANQAIQYKSVTIYYNSIYSVKLEEIQSLFLFNHVKGTLIHT